MEQDGLLYDVTYQRIHKDIMNLTLEPGTELSVRKLAERYQVSRTPAREAVLRLQKEDLVHAYPQSKTIVSKISVPRMREEQFIRRALELAAIDDFVVRTSSLVTDAMEYLIRQQQKYADRQAFEEFFDADNKLHCLIFDTAGKSLAWSCLGVASSHYNRVRFLSIKTRGIGERIVEEHQQLLRAAKRGDAAGMKRVLAVHVNYVGRETERLATVFPRYFAPR